MSRVRFKQNTMTAREMRRMAERENKKEQRKTQLDAWWALTPEERARRMADNEAFQRINRNGITLDDLKNVEGQGRKDGFSMGAEETMKSCYAAICLALHDECGFDTDQCKAVLRAADERVVYALNSEELLNEVKETLDLEFNFHASLDDERIAEV